MCEEGGRLVNNNTMVNMYRTCACVCARSSSITHVGVDGPAQLPEPVVDHAQVLGVAVAEEEGDVGASVYEEEGYASLLGGGKVGVAGGVKEGGGRRLEEEG